MPEARTVEFDYRCACGVVGRIVGGAHQSGARIFDAVRLGQNRHGCYSQPAEIGAPGHWGPVTIKTVAGFRHRKGRWCLETWEAEGDQHERG